MKLKIRLRFVGKLLCWNICNFVDIYFSFNRYFIIYKDKYIYSGFLKYYFFGWLFCIILWVLLVFFEKGNDNFLGIIWILILFFFKKFIIIMLLFCLIYVLFILNKEYVIYIENFFFLFIWFLCLMLWYFIKLLIGIL